MVGERATRDLMITSSAIHSATILIVDDREANVLLLEGILRRDGYTAISSTTDSRKVCELHRVNRYDLILLDLHMPAMDGFEVMASLRALDLDAYLPVLVITAQPGHLLRALQSGARDFISKPFDLAEVLMRVHNLVEMRLLHKEQIEHAKKLEIRNELICETFGRYLSEDVMENLVALPDVIKLGGETSHVTMMMADLRGFTAISETLPPEQVTVAVNHYLDKMVEILLDYGGTIDGFTAGGLLGLFGAPKAHSDDAQRAVACAVAMQLAMTEVNLRNHALGLPAMAMGVGLHTGEVVVGNIGSTQRARYGALGSAVKLAARVESDTMAGQVMISQSTLDSLHGYAEVQKRNDKETKGVSQPIACYSVVGIVGRPDLTLPNVSTFA